MFNTFAQSVDIVVVDRNDSIVYSAEQGGPTEWQVGKSVTWIPLTQQSTKVSSAFGTLEVAEGRRAAMSIPFEDGDGFALVYSLHPSLSSEAANVLSVIPGLPVSSRFCGP